MDATPDYSKCSLRELQDVAARIDKAKYPDRYALVLQELERREPSEDIPKIVRRPLVAGDYFSVFLFWAGGAFLGFVAGVALFVAIFRQHGDGMDYGAAMIVSGLVVSLAGGIAGLVRGIDRIHKN